MATGRFIVETEDGEAVHVVASTKGEAMEIVRATGASPTRAHLVEAKQTLSETAGNKAKAAADDFEHWLDYKGGCLVIALLAMITYHVIKHLL